MNIRKDADNFRNPITSAVSFPAPVFPVSVQLIHHLSNDGFTDCYFTGLYLNLSKCNQGEIVYVFDSTCMIFFFSNVPAEQLEPDNTAFYMLQLRSSSFIK